MSSSHTPDGFPAVSPFLLVADAPRQIAFLVSVFEAREMSSQVDAGGRITHAALAIGDSVIMVGERPQPVVSSIHVYVPDVDATFARALSHHGEALSPPRDFDYGDRSAGVRDPNGNVWWIGTHLAAGKRIGGSGYRM